METLSELPNIGKEMERQLRQVGIETPEDLRAIGAKQAWLRILAVDDSACLHRLYALEGAVEGLPKAMLDAQTKADLKVFFCDAKAK